MCSYKAMRSSWVAACIPLGMALAAILLVTPASQCAAAPQYYTYNITDLDPSGSGDMYTSQATGINNNGQVVGWQQHLGYWYVTYAFRWEPLSGIQYLGNLSGDIFMHDSQAYDINSSGQVAGWSHTPGGGAQGAFLWTEGGTGGAWYNPQVKFLGTLGGSKSFAYGINDMAHVVGWSDTSSGQQHAFLYRNDMTDLGTLGGVSSEAKRINRYDQVVGTAQNASGQDRAFLWSPGAMDGVPTNPQMKDLGDLGGGWSRAYGMNDQGWVVGCSAYGTQIRAFAWDTSGGMRDLGTLGGNSSVAYGVNNLGQIVGSSMSLINGRDDRALIYNKGAVLDLNNYIPANSGWTLTAATGINDSGQICGYGTGPGGYHPFLLTPAPPPPPKMYAVLVGYGDPASEKWLKRTRGDEDAIAMYNVLSKYPGVRPENLWLLINPSTSQDVQTIMGKVVTQLRPGDSLLFYYAGHGFTNDGWPGVTNDEPPVPFGSVARLYGSGESNRGDEYLWLKGGGVEDISDDVLSGWLSSDPKMADVRKMVILDSCFAGGFWGTSGNDTDTGDLDKLSNIGLLAACGEGGVAYTVPGTGRGLFSLAVGEALELTLSGFPRADINLDGALSFDELRYTVGLLYNDQHEGEAGLIRALPWLEEPIESPIEGLRLYSLNSADYDTNAPTIPEPATFFLLALGGSALLNRRRFTSS